MVMASMTPPSAVQSAQILGSLWQKGAALLIYSL